MISRRQPTRTWLQLLVALVLLLTRARGDIFWDNCQSPADHPGQYTGDLYNLCIMDHVFSGNNWSWKLTKANIQNTEFNKCIFTNQPMAPNNFTEASWTNVDFNDCEFGSLDPYGPNITFDKTSLTNVAFKNCLFDRSINLVFKEFSFNNVSFVNCTFRGDTLFTLGEINRATILDSRIRHSDAAATRSGNDAFTLRSVTVRQLTTIGSTFISPMRFEGVNAADVSFNETVFNEFHCHSPPDEENDDFTLRSSFNDSAFQMVRFDDQVTCDQTKWRGFFMGNITFNHHADFSGNEIKDIYWDGVDMNTTTGDCHALNFSRTNINQRVFANITVACDADFESSTFKLVYVRNLRAERPNFKNAIFQEQEYMDGQCCSRVCVSLQCFCNVTDTSGNCPIGNKLVNLTAVDEPSCFPSTARLQRADGTHVTMEQLRHAERVAIGNGEHSDVFFFGHRVASTRASYVEIEHDGMESPLRLSAGHYLYVGGRLTAADTVTTGDLLRDGRGNDVVQVRAVRAVEATGLYAPASLHGDLLVDGIVVSSYTRAVHPRLAHWVLAPVRGLYRAGFKRLVERLSALERRSWEPLARFVGLPRGPDVVVAAT